MKLGIGIDLGGTSIKGVAFDCDEGRELERAAMPTGDGEPVVEGVPKFAQLARVLISRLEQKVGGSVKILGLSG